VNGPTVLVADDHLPVRRGVRLALENGGFRVVAECPDGPSAVASAVRLRPQVCLLDVHMPGDGIKAAAQIRDTVPKSTIVMLTVSSDDEDLFNALKAGASGYLIKDSDPARLCAALTGVLAGEGAMPRQLVGRLITEFRRRDVRNGRIRELEEEDGIILTRREWEVLELLSDDRTTADIAARLDVAQVTVRSHVAAVLKKLRVQSREEALLRLRADVEETQR